MVLIALNLKDGLLIKQVLCKGVMCNRAVGCCVEGKRGSWGRCFIDAMPLEDLSIMMIRFPQETSIYGGRHLD